jgi:hypothetical protein
MTTNTRPVPNTQSPVVDTQTGRLLAPWIQFFQQFVQKAATIIDVSTQSPYTANQNGTVIITGGTGISLKRGLVTINLSNGQAIIPIAISDTVTWASGTVKFLGS